VRRGREPALSDCLAAVFIVNESDDTALVEIRIERLWDGAPVPAEEVATMTLEVAGTNLSVEVSAPFHGDPPPQAPAGSTDGLWNYELVELFLFADGERYLELELGPHGHHLVLLFTGVRQVLRRIESVDYRARVELERRRWHGRLDLPIHLVPKWTSHLNAHALHGEGAARRYLSAWPSSGARPDFHRREAALQIPPGTWLNELRNSQKLLEAPGQIVYSAGMLKIEDQVVGEGAAAQSGSVVSVHYTGTLPDGSKFDSSLDRGKPFEFTLGQGRVIKGWEQGVLGMKVGGKRKLEIPPDLGYGARGFPPVIPANSTLHFEIELLGVR
jgi:hypothetical protein